MSDTEDRDQLERVGLSDQPSQNTKNPEEPLKQLNELILDDEDDHIQDADIDSHGYESASESESESESERGGLSDIGNFASLRLPNFPWPNVTTGIMSTTDSSGHRIASSYQDLLESRREQLTSLIDDLKEGFSLRSALDRFQTIRTLLESEISQTIENNVDTESEDDEKEVKNAEPQVIKAAAEPKDLPLLDQVIIPQTKDPERKLHKRKHSHDHSQCNSHNNNDSNNRRLACQSNAEFEKLTSIQSHEANDQSVLRRKIKAIRKLSISDNEKSHMIQKLMMGAHYDQIKFVDENGDEVLKIDNKFKDCQRSEADNIIDKEQTNYQATVTDYDKTKTYNDEDQEILGCPHYQRNCKMECPNCCLWFGCPICHDEAIADHKFQRNQTRHILCMQCFTPQTPDEFCSHCDLKFASYYCSTCILYDNDETKDIYHCGDCGICRLGLGLGQDFFHCKGCNACLAIELQNEHRCIERVIESNCPICGEFMFTSIKPVVFMSCGHAIHQSCYDDHSKHSYKCPTCQKTVLNMEAQFRVLDMEIRLQPLPHPYSQWSCIIRCNDCNAKSSAPYHVLGLKCDNCKSYNTAQLKLIKPEEATMNTTTDYDSDISTSTNQLRTQTKARDLKHIAINSSNLLNTNFNKEHLDTEDSSTQKAATETPLSAARKEDSTSTSNVLTLPQQFMSNFDQYITNLQEYFSSSDDEEFGHNSGDDVDFLHVNRTFAKLQNRNQLSFQQNNNNDAHDNNNADNNSSVGLFQESINESNNVNNMRATLVNNITNAFNNFLASTDQSQANAAKEDNLEEHDY